MFTAALFTVARRWEHPKCLPMDEWINNIWSILTVKYYSAIERNEVLIYATTGMNFKNIMLSVRS